MGSSIVPGAWIETKDDQFLSMSATSTTAAWHAAHDNVGVKNYIHLKYTGADANHYTTDWSVEVRLNITGFDEFGTATLAQTCTLKVEFDKDVLGRTTDISTFTLPSSYKAHKLKVTVQPSGISYTGITSMPADVLIENFMEVDRTYLMDLINPPAMDNTSSGSVSGCFAYFTANNQIEFHWDYIVGAEEYDFEWVFKSAFDLDPTIDFGKATRITTTNQYYSISHSFDNGHLYYRVRGVGKDLTTIKRQEGLWHEHAGGIAVCNLEDRNWVYNATYSEEGKRKEIMSYFDGSTRNRQSITVNNSTNVALVSEQMYDYEGRPAIATLPAPSSNLRGDLKFYQYFSLNGSGTPYGKKDFDDDNTSLCAAGSTPGMNTTLPEGPSRYYSPDNTVLDGFNGLIPDATDYSNSQSYPFTQVAYATDGTVKIQSAPGEGFQIGKGHETKFFSATPAQEKLDRLFGNEVGYAEHYREEITVDPNGQIYVNYKNLSGKVIATAMRGGTPTNLRQLGLGDNSEFYMNGEEVQQHFSTAYDEASESFLTLQDFMVSDISLPYEFTYEITPQEFADMCTADYKCKYLLEIIIRDDCGLITETSSSVSPPNGSPALNQIHRIDAADYTSSSFTATFTVTFPRIGKYKIEKRLSLDPMGLEEALISYEADIRNPANACITSLTELEETYEDGIDMTECMSCEESCEYEATQISFTEGYVYDSEHTFYNAEDFIEFCQSLCEYSIPAQTCDGLLAQLKADMSPGGQYFDATIPPVSSILTPVDYIYGLQLLNSTFYSGFVSYATTHGYDAVPASGAGLHAALTTAWDPRWSNYLVQFHPEYCRWQRCENLSESRDFDANLLNSHYATTTLTTTTCVSNDDYFITLDASNATNMSGQVSGCSNCNAHYGASPLNTLSLSAANSMWDWAQVAPLPIPGGLSTGDYNEARWKNFVKLYVSTKSELYVSNYQGSSCPAIPESYPPDLLTDAIAVVNPTSAGYTFQLTGLTIRDPEPADIFETIIDAVTPPSGGWTSSPDISELTDVPCVYSNALMSITNAHLDVFIDEITCHCNSSSSATLTLQSFIPFKPLNYPFDMTSSTGPGTSTAANGVTVNCSTFLALSTADRYAYLYSALNTAINGYYGTPYDFTSTIVTTGGVTTLQVAAPVSLGLFGNDVSFTLTYCGPPPSIKFDFEGATEICSPDLNSISCLCIQISQMYEFYQTGHVSGTLTILEDGTTPVSYTSFASYSAAMLNDMYPAELPCTTAVTSSNVLQWWANCNLSVPGSQIPMQSPYELDATGAVIANTSNSNNIVPCQVVCNEDEPCQQQGTEEASYYANAAYEYLVTQALEDFAAEYKKACLNKTALNEKFKVVYDEPEYHYTLYYYDQAGNLVRTVPPNAVSRLTATEQYLGGENLVHTARLHENDPLPPAKIYPKHSRFGQGTNPANLLVTNYKYNTLNQLIEQETPDGGLTKFWYNSIGQLRFSQNAKQVTDVHLVFSPYGKYSYTIYDGQGRIIEVGENGQPAEEVIGGITTMIPFYNGVNTQAFPTNFGKQVTKTYYDNEIAGTSYGQEFLRKRVTAVSIEENEDNNDLTYDNASYYSYDVHGNVNKLQLHYPDLADNGNQLKTVEYTYDLISANVKTVNYQNGQFDQFYHKYEYDADNRITHAYTSSDKIHWQQDARYFYYLHGPLARIEYGEDKVQSLDYAYTLQGWIKGVNSNNLGISSGTPNDRGLDGYTGTYTSGQPNTHQNVARDVFGYTLDYYTNDFRSIASGADARMTGALSGTALTTTPSLYNGNIRGMTTAMYQSNLAALPSEMPTMARFFEYDQLNRIIRALSYETTADALSLTAHLTPSTSNYAELLAYDANGNILKAQKNAYGTDYIMDQLTYDYSTPAINNQLDRVTDVTSIYSTDIDNQSSGNYGYDQIGNLTSDQAEGINNIDWNVYGKIRKISKADKNIEFKYNASGQRILKLVKEISGVEETQENWTYTYYMRDAQGNVLAVYDREIDVTGGSTVTDKLFLSESHIYGSARLGLTEETTERQNITPGIIATATGYNGDGTIIRSGPSAITPATYIPHNSLGNKRYELANHLGNVNVVISDRKLSVPSGITTIHSYYIPDVLSAQDYYSFGAVMPGREHTPGYRYGFNGKENDNEVKNVDGSQQDYGMRIYDPRLGRFLSVDPLLREFPSISPYLFANNTPIQEIDFMGLAGARPGPGGRPGLRLETTLQRHEREVRYDRTALAVSTNGSVLFTRENYNALLRNRIREGSITIEEVHEINWARSRAVKEATRTTSTTSSGAELLKLPNGTSSGIYFNQSSLVAGPNTTPLKSEKPIYWGTSINFNNTEVFQRDDLFDPHAILGTDGLTNIQRMELGLAPLGYDKLEIQLHHLVQTDKSALAEVSTTFHRVYFKTIHMFVGGKGNKKPEDMQINRTGFNTFRSEYWKNRAKAFKIIK
jgi:RHS repeat-associated protein